MIRFLNAYMFIFSQSLKILTHKYIQIMFFFYQLSCYVCIVMPFSLIFFVFLSLMYLRREFFGYNLSIFHASNLHHERGRHQRTLILIPKQTLSLIHYLANIYSRDTKLRNIIYDIQTQANI